jgi:hypothetical protein
MVFEDTPFTDFPFNEFMGLNEESCTAGYILDSPSVPIIAAPIYSHIVVLWKDRLIDFCAI